MVTDDPRSDPSGVSVPFIFVGHGDPLPARWMAEHPGSLKVPAVMVPRGTRPSPTQGAAGAGAAAAALKPVPAAESRILGSFVPPPARRQRLPNGQPWPQDRNGRDWPKDRWGRPTRPLWDYPPGVRAPGEGVAPGAPGGIGEADAIASARAALGVLDPANLRAILAGDRTGAGTGGTQTPARGVASRYPGAYDVAQAGSDQTGIWSDALPVAGASPGLPTSGEASTYSDELAGQATASGHIYRHEEYTAALLPRSRWSAVPLGTKLRITHAGRTVVVEVNDRGRGNGRETRVLDLSHAAMAQLTGQRTKDINNQNAGLVHLDSIEVVPADTKVGPR